VAAVLDGCFDGAGVQGICPCPVSFLPLFFAGTKKSGYKNFNKSLMTNKVNIHNISYASNSFKDLQRTEWL